MAVNLGHYRIKLLDGLNNKIVYSDFFLAFFIIIIIIIIIIIVIVLFGAFDYYSTKVLCINIRV